MNKAISNQTGISEFNGQLGDFTGARGGLVPDIHTLKNFNPLTDNRTIVVMYRGPYFLMEYFGGTNAYRANSEFATYKNIIEYWNSGVRCEFGDQSLGSAQYKAGFAGRTINVPTQQNAQQSQSLTITVPEMKGCPISNFHNMWVDGIADPINGLTNYQGLVSGYTENEIEQRIFSPATGVSNDIALEPSLAYEVAEFLVIPLDRSGARAEGAALALGCTPTNKVGYQKYGQNSQGNSQIVSLELRYNCQFFESAFVNDIASRYLKQFATFGNKLNLNPGVGDAFFKNATSTEIDTQIFNGGKRPALDPVQSGIGNGPVFYANPHPVSRQSKAPSAVEVADHSRIYNGPNANDFNDIPSSFAQPNTKNG